MYDKNAARARKNEKKVREGKCLQCGASVTWKLKPKKYCDSRCKSSYHARSARRTQWDDANYDKRMLYRVKTSAKSKGIPFNLTEEDFVIPEYCPVLGIKLEYGVGKGYSPASPSCDKINPKKGYVKGNCRIISARANLLKSDATVEELELVLEDLKKYNPTTTILEETFE